MRDGKKSKSGKGFRGKGKAGEDMEKPKFKSDVRKKWQTKNQKKRERELKEVAKEQAEAEAEVDKEERAQVVSRQVVQSGHRADDNSKRKH
jgi:nucleolar complex protein 3